MNFIARHAGLTLAGLLTLYLAFAHYRRGESPIEPAPTVPAVAAPQAPAAAVKAKRRAPRTLTAKAPAPPAAPAIARGERLREKGEAFGGGTPDRVDASTQTRTSP